MFMECTSAMGTPLEQRRGNGGAEEGGREELVCAAREQAVRFLARRDHSRHELRHKLRTRGHAADVVDAAIARLAQTGLQSDQRYADSFVRSALNRGCGERKIRAGLRSSGIGESLAAASLSLDDEQWVRLAVAALSKRFGATPPENDIELAKRMRFLIGRGFSEEVALRVLDHDRASSFEVRSL